MDTDGGGSKAQCNSQALLFFINQEGSDGEV